VPDYDPKAPHARRYPRGSTRTEIDTMLRLSFHAGIEFVHDRRHRG
jgi:hypothetical protein